MNLSHLRATWRLPIACCAALWFPVMAFAQAYPERSVTLVVPYAPGGATDSSARLVAQALQRRTGASFVVENVPGAGTTIGAARVAKAAADGYTLLWGGLSSNVIAPRLYEKLPFNVRTAFEPVATVAAQPFLILTKADSPYRRLEDLTAVAKAQPGKINFGSPGQGSSPHLNSELLLASVGAIAVHVPYRGASPALAALLAGDIDFMSDTPTAPMPLLRAGQLRALAVTSRTRLPELPEVPTVAESGVPRFESSTWFAVFAPRGTPEAVVQRLSDLIREVLDSADIRQQMARAYFSVLYENPSTLARRVDVESVVWEGVLRERHITAE